MKLSMLSVKESYPDMARDDIADTVLGKRSGRIPGPGFGPRSEKSNPLRGASSKVREEELESIVSTQQEQLQCQEDQIKRLEEMVIKLMEERNAST